jgi:hypothetical protein
MVVLLKRHEGTAAGEAGEMKGGEAGEMKDGRALSNTT